MTEFEILEVIDNFATQMMMSTTLYFTLLSGYLISTYLVGNRLSKIQAVIVSAMYFVWISTLPFSLYTYGLQISIAQGELISLDSAYVHTDPSVIRAWSVGFFVLQYVAILTSIYYMWHVRCSRDR